MVPLALVTGVSIGVLEARERFFALNVLQTTGVVVGQIVPVICAVVIGPSLSIVIPAAVLSRSLSNAAVILYAMRAEGLYRIWGFDWSRGRSLLAYGGWVSVTNIIDPLLTSLDQILIGSLIDARAVTFYSVPMNLVNRTQIFAAAMARTLFPRMSRVSQTEAHDLAERAVSALAYGLAAVCAPAIILVGQFFALWISPEFSLHAASVAEILLVGSWMNGLAFMPYALLQGQGRPDIVAKCHALEVIPFIALLWLLLHFYGLGGAAAAWTLRVTIDAGLLFGAAGFRFYHAVRALPALGLLVAAFCVSTMFGTTLPWSIVIAAAFFLATGLCAVAIDPTCRRIFSKSVARLLQIAVVSRVLSTCGLA
jgi:O-antigen/teichoic acid export membrane protein